MRASNHSLFFRFSVHSGEQLYLLLIGSWHLVYGSTKEPAAPAFAGRGEGTMMFSHMARCALIYQAIHCSLYFSASVSPIGRRGECFLAPRHYTYWVPGGAAAEAMRSICPFLPWLPSFGYKNASQSLIPLALISSLLAKYSLILLSSKRGTPLYLS